ncbi:Hypothetical predicted protein [Octopus vulgaris]|uniref:Uncharacterized protein n=1 Tax=Octopus vulgaris TaxID=6645 RepID=A0AA36F8Z4_OCTVU|nr:Hypothetical predicted protein [Octopus vulgaris]
MRLYHSQNEFDGIVRSISTDREDASGDNVHYRFVMDVKLLVVAEVVMGCIKVNQSKVDLSRIARIQTSRSALHFITAGSTNTVPIKSSYISRFVDICDHFLVSRIIYVPDYLSISVLL